MALEKTKIFLVALSIAVVFVWFVVMTITELREAKEERMAAELEAQPKTIIEYCYIVLNNDGVYKICFDKDTTEQFFENPDIKWGKILHTWTEKVERTITGIGSYQLVLPRDDCFEMLYYGK